MINQFLPPLELCCEKCHLVKIQVHSNATLHFKTSCLEHGDKGVPSPFAKSVKLDYEIQISPKLDNVYHKSLFK